MAVDSWACLKTTSVTLVPSEEIVGGWKAIGKMLVTLTPSEEIFGGWKLLSAMTTTLKPPTMVCSTNADCPEGYVCENGVCIKKEAPFPLSWLVIGGATAAGIILIASAIKKERRAKK